MEVVPWPHATAVPANVLLMILALPAVAVGLRADGEPVSLQWRLLTLLILVLWSAFLVAVL